MLFAIRDLKETLGFNFSQRFSSHINRYLTPANTIQISRPTHIDLSACYTVLGINDDDVQGDLVSLEQLTQQISRAYHRKTKRWLNQEQIALAIIWHDTQQQAITLKEQFRQQTIPLPALSSSAPLLYLAFLADALHIKQINHPNSQASIKPCACRRTLGLILDETSTTEIERIGREVREDCEAALLKQGTNLEGLQTCWRLKVRYVGCEHSLTLKCMPMEMLREVFETQHAKKYGKTDENRVIMIDELEIEVGLPETVPTGTAKESVYINQWMSQWDLQHEQHNQHWLKQEKVSIQQQFSWLTCPILGVILAKLVTTQATNTLPDFFIINHQKEVDEAAMRN